jgi:hypothetical protein
MSYDPALWVKEVKPTQDGTDEVVLRATDWAPSAEVIFRTFPYDRAALAAATPEQAIESEADIGPGYLEDQMLEERRGVGDNVDEAIITVGEDQFQRAIYGVFNPNDEGDKRDDHWIGSYAIRHIGDSDSDRIIELDCIGYPETEGVLLIHASSSKEEYNGGVYQEVERIRHTIYEWYRQTLEAGRQHSMLALSSRSAGGTRPMVQY